MSVELKELIDHGANLSYNFNFDFKETYTNNSEAIKWIDFIAAFFSGEEVEIKSETLPTINTKKINLSPKENNFDNYKAYYQNIKKIEMLTGVNFTEYHDCTEERFKISNTIVAILTQKPIIVRGKEPVKFSVEVNENTDFAQTARDEKNLSIISTEMRDKSYTLNGREFTVAYTHTIFNSCAIVGLKKKRKKLKVDFESSNLEYSVLLSNKSAEELYPNMQYLDLST